MAALSFHEAPQAASLATPGALSSRPGRARTERKELDWTALIVPRSADCRLYNHWGDMWAESDSCSLDWWTVDRDGGVRSVSGVTPHSPDSCEWPARSRDRVALSPGQHLSLALF